ncbi:hypothetical protein J2Z62_000076 [Mycoplasmoides fastidiosum]|uniref:Lipoprotein-associated type-17 domain-containing protein n=1 Tax=Mycoplasmoides fastidiosum TaxID=92758 RepID=A0ABU0LY50_9BACT|nr:lipoprotein 17-related variable surface protein [Mycoplasmoides fastidiosum]MDQ0513638.1 hypothetical protein [Mycoplasmoides fastidiosum]UUD37941.1 lipoprotein 17-related variable surface protein [Mycoplasmoides fastidiosum]
MTKRKVKFLGIFTILLISFSITGTEVKLSSHTINQQQTTGLNHQLNGAKTANPLLSHMLTRVTHSSSVTGPTTSIYLPSSVSLTDSEHAWDQDNLLLASQITAEKIRQLLVINPAGSGNNSAETPTQDNSGYKFEKLKTDNSKTYESVEKNNLNTDLGFSLGTLTASSLNSIGIEIVEVDDLAGVLGFRVYQTLQTYTVEGSTFSRGTANLDKISQYRAVILPPTKYGTKPTTPEPVPAASNTAAQPAAPAAPAAQTPATETPAVTTSSSGGSTPAAPVRAARDVSAKSGTATTPVDNSVWYLPTDQFPLKKDEFIFAWKTDRLVNDWIRNSSKKASEVTDTDVKNYLVSVLRTFDNTTHNHDVPQFTVERKPNDANGQLEVTIKLDPKYRNSIKEVKRNFFGFSGSTIPNQGIKLNYISEQVLTNAVIKQPVWNSGSGVLEVNYVNRQVKDLLPSQFFDVNANRIATIEYTPKPEMSLDSANPSTPSSSTTTTNPPATSVSNSAPAASASATSPAASGGSSSAATPTSPEKQTRLFNFVDLFNGETINSSTYGNTPALELSKEEGMEKGIGYLTFNGKKSGDADLGNLSNFGITKIEGYPNDRAGTLNLLVHYTSPTESGALIEGTPEIIIYQGFQTNVDTGQSLFFSWKDKLPEQYANLTPANTVSIFQETAGLDPANSNLNNFVDTEQAKTFVSQFFTGSEYILDKYNAKYDSLRNEGAKVSLSVNSVTNPTTRQTTESILVQVQFAQFGQEKDKIFRKYFYPSSQATIVPSALQATLRPNPNFAFQGHIYSNKLASELTLDEIRNLFNFRIPESGQNFTSPLDEATFFYAANDRLGELIVSIIFPKFNNIEKYQFSYKFTNFKINTILKTKLELNFTPLINLSSEFLAKDPASIVDLTPKDVLNNLFDTLPEQIFSLLSEDNIQIVERGSDYIIVEVSLNWNDLTSGTHNANRNNNSATPTNQAFKTKVLHDDETAIDPDNQVIRFRIDGFTGGNSRIFSNNQSPKILGDVLTEQEILMIGSSIGGGLFGILLVTGLYVLIRNWRLKNSHFLASDTEKKLTNSKKKKFKSEE